MKFTKNVVQRFGFLIHLTSIYGLLSVVLSQWICQTWCRVPTPGGFKPEAVNG